MSAPRRTGAVASLQPPQRRLHPGCDARRVGRLPIKRPRGATRMAPRDIARALAKTATATALGGPLIGARAGATEAIDLIANWLGGRQKDAYEVAVTRVERDLEQFARSERLPAQFVDQALEQAR